jgi:hypothetical protein
VRVEMQELLVAAEATSAEMMKAGWFVKTE